MAGPYSAGSIFLQVIPSYDNFMTTLRRDAKSLADEMNKSVQEEVDKGPGIRPKFDTSGGRREGEKAGKESARGFGGAFERELQSRLSSSASALPKVKLSVDPSEANREIQALRKELQKLGKAKIGVDVDGKAALAQMAALEKEIERLTDKPHSIETHVNLARSLADLRAFRATVQKTFSDPILVDFRGKEPGAFARKIKSQIEGALKALGDTEIGVRAAGAEDSITRIREQLASLRDARIGVDVDDTEAISQLLALQAELDKIKADDNVRISTRVDSAGASAQLAALKILLDEIDGDDIDIDINTDKVRRSGNDALNAASGFRSLNGILFLIVSTGPLLVPVLAAIGGGLLAIGPAAIGAATGLGVLAIGFSGITAAVQALGKAQNAEAKDAISSGAAIRSAANAVASARSGLARAQESASRSISDALQTEEDAERSLTRAQEASAQAQRDLVDARRKAAQDLRDLQNQAQSGKLDERQGVIDVFNATVANAATQADPGASNLEKEQSSINLARAQLALKQTREQNTQLAAEKKKADRDGVDGTERVKTAQDNVTSAVEAERAARERLGRASRDVTRAQVDGARSVADAQRSLSNALAAQQEAAQKTSELGSAAQQAVDQAMDALGPAGRKFALFINGLRGDLRGFRDDVQTGLLPGVEDSITRLLDTYGPGLSDFLTAMGGALGDIFRQVGATLTNPAFKAFFDMIAATAPQFTQDFATILLNISEGIANVMTAFSPTSVDFSSALVDMSESFKTFTAGLSTNPEFKSFIAYLRKEGPRVWKLVKDIGGALINLGEGLAPYADKLIDFIDAIAVWLRDTDPAIVGKLAVAFIVLVGAFQALSVFVALFGTGGIFATIGATFSAIGTALFGTAESAGLLATVGSVLSGVLTAIAAALGITVGAVLGILAVLALLVVGFVIAYKKSETFRNIVNGVLNAIADAGIWLWEHALKPAFNGIKDGFFAVGRFLQGVWNDRLYPIFDLFLHIGLTIWEKVLKPAFHGISVGFSAVGDAIGYVWDHVLKPVFDTFMDIIGDKLVSAFETGVEAIKTAWEKVKGYAKAPIRFVVDTVINKGLIDKVFNPLADFFGSTKMKPVTLPEGFATGGWTGAGSRLEPAGIVHRDEFVVKKSSRRRIETMAPGLLDFINTHGTLPGYDIGGTVGRGGTSTHPVGGKAGLLAFARLLQSMGFRISENPSFGGVHPVHTKGSAHYTGDAIDVNYAPGTSPAEQRELAKVVPLAKGYGLRSIFMVAGHYNHAHFDDLTSADMLGKGASSGGNSAIGRIIGALSSPAEWIKSKVSGLKDAIAKEFPDNKFTEILGGLPGKIGDAIIDKVTQLAALAGDVLSTAGDALSGGAGKRAPAGQIGAQVAQVASRFGWNTGANWTALQAIISEESSWNPNAQNPSSTAYGLFQFLDSTWGTVGGAKTSNVEAQAELGMRYIKQRYGDPVKAQQFHVAHGYYADGGRVEQPTLYDTGGILPPGISQVVNASRKPEGILNNADMEAFRALAKAAAEGRLGGSSGPVIDARSYGTQLTPYDVVDEVMHGLRRTGRTGLPATAGGLS